MGAGKGLEVWKFILDQTLNQNLFDVGTRALLGLLSLKKSFVYAGNFGFSIDQPITLKRPAALRKLPDISKRNSSTCKRQVCLQLMRGNVVAMVHADFSVMPLKPQGQ